MYDIFLKEAYLWRQGINGEKLRPLTVHQLFPFFNLGLIVAQLPSDDLHPTSNFFLQAGFVRTFGATLAASGPLDATEVIGFVERARLLQRFRTGGLLFGRDSPGFSWGVL